MKLKGAIFDLDGTLLDSMYVWETTGEAYLIRHGITPEKGLNERFQALSIMQAAQYYREHYGITDSVEEIIDDVNKTVEHLYESEVLPKPGVLQFLEELRGNGVKLCVATATDRYMVEAALQRIGILQYFESILTCTEVGFGKDRPIIFEQALGKLGTSKADTIVFEDALYAIETAKKAGFRVAAVYDDSSKKQQAEIRALADYYATSFQDWGGIANV